MSNRQNVDLRPKKAKSPSRLVVLNPSKGLNTLVSPLLIDDKEFSASLNIQYDEGGVARTRDGISKVGGVLSNAKGLGVFVTPAYRQILTCADTTLMYYDENIGAWTPCSGTKFTISASNGLISFTQAQGKYFAWNGNDPGIVWNGATASNPGTIPSASFSIYYQNKHIASGVPGQENRLYIAAVADPADFTVATGGTPPQPDNSTDVPGATVFSGTPGLTEANILDIRKNDGDKIKGLGIFQDQVIVFKERSIFSLTFDATGAPTVTPITNATGCISNHTIQAVENDLYFMSREGLRSLGNQAQYFDAIRTSVLSAAIQPTFDDVTANLYPSYNAVYWQNKFMVAAPIPIAPDASSMIVYDRRFQAFSRWDTITADAMVVYTGWQNDQHLYVINDVGTQMYELSSANFTDDGQNIETYLISKAQAFGTPDITKFFVDLGLIFRAVTGSVDITIYDDDGTTLGTTTLASTTGPTSLMGLGIDYLGYRYLGIGGSETSGSTSITDVPIRIVLNRQLRTLKFKISTSGSGGRFIFAGMIYAVFPNSHYLFDSSHKLYI